MPIHKTLLPTAVLTLLALLPHNGIGCGPMFPEELIFSRGKALKEPPPASFSKEIRKLMDQPLNDLPLVEIDLYGGEPQNEHAKVESEGLTKEEAGKLAAMRLQATGDAAYEIGDGLPEAIRLYTAGAVDFHRAFPGEAYGDTDITPEQTSAAAEKARLRFAAVLALPEDQNRNRAVWAAYMLGRIAAKHDDGKLAAEYFQKTRQSVKAGLADPFGLAVSSLGEEARLHLRRGEIAEAVQLYLQQLAHGSKSAETSLKFVARKLEKDPILLDEALANPLTQRLVFADLYTKDVGKPFSSLENYSENIQLAVDYSDVQAGKADNPSAETNQPPDTANQAENNRSGGEADPAPAIWRKIADSIEHQGLTQVAGADWLAAAAYNKGQFRLAQRLVDKDNSPLSLWVKAKLALRAGNQEAALAAYSAVVQAFPAEGKPKPDDFYEAYTPEDDSDGRYAGASLLYRVNVERGILHLARGEYLQALTHLYQGSARYWADTAYVAERILTVAELKGFVDSNIPVPSITDCASATESGHLTPAMRIRQLLARRLMRAEHLDEAIGYFDNLKLKALAEDYRHQLRSASDWWRGDIAKAEARFEAAKLARFNGMELMGYELAPDFSLWEGYYDPSDYVQGYTKLEGELLGPDEPQRFEASQANPNIRFHYRLTASEQASKAADLLPHTSQAFAAVLCEATRWILVRQPAYAAPLYQRYLREGSLVPWGKAFGQQCPAPDFQGAEKRLWLERFNHLKQPAYLSISALVAGLIGFVIHRRRIGSR
jgi:cellulose synthase operon protein C